MVRKVMNILGVTNKKEQMTVLSFTAIYLALSMAQTYIRYEYNNAKFKTFACFRAADFECYSEMVNYNIYIELVEHSLNIFGVFISDYFSRKLKDSLISRLAHNIDNRHLSKQQKEALLVDHAIEFSRGVFFAVGNTFQAVSNTCLSIFSLAQFSTAVSNLPTFTNVGSILLIGGSVVAINFVVSEYLSKFNELERRSTTEAKALTTKELDVDALKKATTTVLFARNLRDSISPVANSVVSSYTWHVFQVYYKFIISYDDPEKVSHFINGVTSFSETLRKMITGSLSLFKVGYNITNTEAPAIALRLVLESEADKSR